MTEQLTGREHLELFAQLRGIEPAEIPMIATNLLQLLQLGEHADKAVGEYSGGNRRKLCCAIALVGTPAVLFLDEVRLRRRGAIRSKPPWSARSKAAALQSDRALLSAC